MGRFASGVTVITSGHGDDVRGMTANAFMSASLDPPLCVVSIAKRARLHAQLLRESRFGVNILAENQESHANYFAGRPGPKPPVEFETIACVPLLKDVGARIAAETVARHDCGDHTLFVGHILHMDSDDRPPLIYHAGHYAGLVRKLGDHDVMVPEFW
jgi:flavin reductase (DIM6/NTAB) family NADH-FMN oxidoreductase RutF